MSKHALLFLAALLLGAAAAFGPLINHRVSKVRPPKADPRIHQFVAADGSRRTFPQSEKSAPTAVGDYDCLNPPCRAALSLEENGALA